jgi:hypothetical protein
MLCITIVVGFALMTLGVALLFLGEVPFIAGRRISAPRSRLIGGVLVSFLPLAVGIRFLCAVLFGDEAVDGLAVTAFVFSFCVLATFVILFRVLVPKRPPRPQAAKTNEPAKKTEPAKKPAAAKPNPFDQPAPAAPEPAPEWMEPAPEPAPKPTGKKRPAKESGKNPFDFS